MLRTRLIAIAIVSVASLISQRSFAQQQVCSDDDPPYGNLSCTGGSVCSNYDGWVAQPVNYGEGFFWNPEIMNCPGQSGCHVLNYNTNYDFCYGTELRNKETLDQLAELSLSRNVVIADCQGHYRQYRRHVSVRPDRAYGEEVLR